MGIEPTFTVWQTVVLAVILHLHMRSLSALESIPITFVESTRALVYGRWRYGTIGAGRRTRTPDLLFTRELHYHCAIPAYKGNLQKHLQF